MSTRKRREGVKDTNHIKKKKDSDKSLVVAHDLLSFPWEVLELILSHLTVAELGLISRVSSRFRAFANNPQLWKLVFDKQYHFVTRKELLLSDPADLKNNPHSNIYRKALELRWRATFFVVDQNYFLNPNDFAQTHPSLSATLPLCTSPQNVIILKPGVYQETFAITKPVEIIGDGPRDKIVVRSRSTTLSSSPLLISASRTRMMNLTFTSVWSSGKIHFEGGEHTVEECDVKCETYLGPNCKAVLRRNKIREGEKAGVIMLHDHTEARLEYNFIFGNHHGIAILSDETHQTDIKCSLYKNRITNNRANGILIDGAKSSCIISDCDIAENGKYGVKVRNSGKAHLKNNQLHHNGRKGVLGKGRDVTIEEDNKIFDNASQQSYFSWFTSLGDAILHNDDSRFRWRLLACLVMLAVVVWHYYSKASPSVPSAIAQITTPDK